MPSAVEFLSNTLSVRLPLTEPILFNRYDMLKTYKTQHIYYSMCFEMYISNVHVWCVVSCRDCTGGGIYYVTPGPERPCFFTCQSTTTCVVVDIPEDHLRVSQ